MTSIAVFMCFAAPLMAMDPNPGPESVPTLTAKQQYACEQATLIESELTRTILTLFSAISEYNCDIIHHELLVRQNDFDVLVHEMGDLCCHAETRSREKIDEEFSDIKQRLISISHWLDSGIKMLHDAGLDQEATEDPKQHNRKRYEGKKEHTHGKSRHK